MNVEEFGVLMQDTFDNLRSLNETKGNDYRRGEDDTFANFKRQAATLGISQSLVWAVYAGKHWDAIMTYCRDGQVESEPIEGRIDDLILYLLLSKSRVQPIP